MISNKFLIKFIGIFCISISTLSILLTYIDAIHLDVLGMDLTTALSFILSGFTFLLLTPVEIAKKRKIFGKLCALAVTIISIREMYFGQMAPGSAICFILIGLALYFLQTHKSKLQWFSQMCALIGAFITFGGIMTELYGIHDLTGIFTPEKISFPRIRVLLFLLSYGILISRPTWKLTEVFFSPSLGGKYLRKLLPTIMGALIVFGIVGLVGEFIGIAPVSGAVIFQLLAMLVFFYIMWKSAVDLDRIDRAHKAELEKRLDYEKLFNLSFDMICIASSEGYFKYLNDAFERILGFSRQDLLDKSFLEFVHPEDRAKSQAEMMKLTRGKVTSTYMENRYVCKDGSYKILGWTSAWAEKEGIIFAVARDLTIVKKSEEDLRSAYEFVEAILDNVPNMIFVKDAKELRFLRFNKAGEELLGYTRGELLGKNDYDFFPKEQADFFSSKDRLVLSGKAIIEIMEEPIQTKHLGKRLLRTKKIPIYDLHGHPQYLLGISEDITDLKRLNEERERTEIILRSAERINSLIQNSLDAVVGMNDEGLVISWNSQAEKIFNWNKEEAIGRPLADLIIPSRFRMAHKEGIKTFVRTGVGPILNNRIELIGLRRGEVEFPVELAVTPIQENLKWLFYAFVRDISDRKNFEQQQKMLLADEHAAREAAERTMNMQDDFLSIAAHELRTPITPISMQLQLIERVIKNVNENQVLGTMKEKLLRITNNSNKELDRLSNLIDELLDVSRISAGRLLLNLEEINLSEIVQVLVNRHQVAAHNAGINLQLKLEPEVIGLWDSTRLESLVENLITNAIKYGDGKPVEVKLETREKKAILTVKDNGIGISKADQQRIFKKFERAASVKDYTGLGLGLYISSEIVKAHGGSIKLESEPQRGSTFLVELPFKTNLS